jgi:structural maintenance of chromosome 4
MDEIDAALDYKNVTNLGKYIKDKQQVQHIVISLRKNMYEQCNSLVCIYKVNDVSRTMKVDMKDLYGVGGKVKATKRVMMTKNKL